MDIKNFFRKLFVKFNAPSSAKEKKPSWIKQRAQTLAKISTDSLNAILKLIFVIFTVVWAFITALFISGRYIDILGEPITFFLVIIGLNIELVVGVKYFQRNPEKLLDLLLGFYRKMKATNIYGKFSQWMFEISKMLVKKIVLPNIDLIEPNLTGQHTHAFPDVIIYKDQSYKSSDVIRNARANYGTLMAVLMFFGFLPLLPVMVLGVTKFFVSQSIATILENMMGFFAVCVLGFILVIELSFIHPDSLIAKRMKILNIELNRLRQDEWLNAKIEEVEQDANFVMTEYEERIRELRRAFYNELRKLDALKKENLITRDSIEDARKLIRERQDVIGLILTEYQNMDEEREKKKYWKDKAIDIAIGFLVGIMTTYIGYVLTR